MEPAPAYQNLIDGKWSEEPSGARFDVTDPATDRVVASVPDAGADTTKRAIDAARRALPGWSRTPAPERARLLRRAAELMARDRERLALLMTREQGKPLKESSGEIDYAASFLSWNAGEAERIAGETVPASVPGKRLVVIRQPAGVVATITPWNFPSAMITRKLGPALAAGCTCVVKPAEQTPLSALALGELLLEAGFPSGSVNIVTGEPAPIARTMLEHPAIRVLSFTGSTEVGRRLIEGSSANITRLALELGGHAPVLVFDDADPVLAAEQTMLAKFRNAGQTCICPNRIYVQAGIYDRFMEAFCARVASLRVGIGTDEDTDIGPLIDDDAVAKVRAHIADALDKGGRAVVGGAMATTPEGCADRFHEPTVIEGFTPEMDLACAETFGPVAPVARFAHEQEAIDAANDSVYGLAAYFFTRDNARLIRVAEALEYGVIGANDGRPSAAQIPFGGFKCSGIGREGGRHGIEEFLETKLVSIGLG